MAWDGIVTTYHKKHIKIGSHIQIHILKKTLESISFKNKRVFGEEGVEDEIQEAIKKLESIEAKGE